MNDRAALWRLNALVSVRDLCLDDLAKMARGHPVRYDKWTPEQVAEWNDSYAAFQVATQGVNQLWLFAIGGDGWN